MDETSPRDPPLVVNPVFTARPPQTATAPDLTHQAHSRGHSSPLYITGRDGLLRSDRGPILQATNPELIDDASPPVIPFLEAAPPTHSERVYLPILASVMTTTGYVGGKAPISSMASVDSLAATASSSLPSQLKSSALAPSAHKNDSVKSSKNSLTGSSPLSIQDGVTDASVRTQENQDNIERNPQALEKDKPAPALISMATLSSETSSTRSSASTGNQKPASIHVEPEGHGEQDEKDKAKPQAKVDGKIKKENGQAMFKVDVAQKNRWPVMLPELSLGSNAKRPEQADNNPATAANNRYSQSGRNEVLTEANARSTALTTLGVAVWKRYGKLGNIEDLNESISHHREALRLRPLGHPQRSWSIFNIGVTLFQRYKNLRRAEDLEDSITHYREALSLRPLGHPEHGHTLSTLAFVLNELYLHAHRIEDLEEAIAYHRQALEFHPIGHPKRCLCLFNFGVFVNNRYRKLGRIEDLEEAIAYHREALSLRPLGHPDRCLSLNRLGNVVNDRYMKFGRVEDLEEAISCQREALGLHIPGHSERPAALNNSGNAANDLDEGAQGGNPKHDQDSLVQSTSVGQEKPDMLPSLDASGLEPNDQLLSINCKVAIDSRGSGASEELRFQTNGFPADSGPSLLVSFDHIVDQTVRSALEDGFTTTHDSVETTPLDGDKLQPSHAADTIDVQNRSVIGTKYEATKVPLDESDATWFGQHIPPSPWTGPPNFVQDKGFIVSSPVSSGSESIKPAEKQTQNSANNDYGLCPGSHKHGSDSGFMDSLSHVHAPNVNNISASQGPISTAQSFIVHSLPMIETNHLDDHKARSPAAGGSGLQDPFSNGIEQATLTNQVLHGDQLNVLESTEKHLARSSPVYSPLEVLPDSLKVGKNFKNTQHSYNKRSEHHRDSHNDNSQWHVHNYGSEFWTVRVDLSPTETLNETIAGKDSGAALRSARPPLKELVAESSDVIAYPSKLSHPVPPMTLISAAKGMSTVGTLATKGRLEASTLVKKQLATVWASDRNDPLSFLEDAANIGMKILSQVEAIVKGKVDQNMVELALDSHATVYIAIHTCKSGILSENGLCTAKEHVKVLTEILKNTFQLVVKMSTRGFMKRAIKLANDTRAILHYRASLVTWLTNFINDPLEAGLEIRHALEGILAGSAVFRSSTAQPPATPNSALPSPKLYGNSTSRPPGDTSVQQPSIIPLTEPAIAVCPYSI